MVSTLRKRTSTIQTQTCKTLMRPGTPPLSVFRRCLDDSRLASRRHAVEVAALPGGHLTAATAGLQHVNHVGVAEETLGTLRHAIRLANRCVSRAATLRRYALTQAADFRMPAPLVVTTMRPVNAPAGMTNTCGNANRTAPRDLGSATRLR
jgi:hypothetical protein